MPLGHLQSLVEGHVRMTFQTFDAQIRALSPKTAENKPSVSVEQTSLQVHFWKWERMNIYPPIKKKRSFILK